MQADGYMVSFGIVVGNDDHMLYGMTFELNSSPGVVLYVSVAHEVVVGRICVGSDPFDGVPGDRLPIGEFFSISSLTIILTGLFGGDGLSFGGVEFSEINVLPSFDVADEFTTAVVAAVFDDVESLLPFTRVWLDGVTFCSCCF